MKIPEDKYFSTEADNAWEWTAAQIGIEYGIIVEIGREKRAIQSIYPHPISGVPCTFNFERTVRIFFKLYDHEFETLTDLKRALQLKAFL